MNHTAITYNEESNRTGSPFDALKQVTEHGAEYWSARDLAPLMGYTSTTAWQNFENALNRAAVSAQNQGHDTKHHFSEASKVIQGGRWGKQTVKDIHLTRFAAYLTAMNGDPNKSEVAAAQAYFAIQTHAAESRAVKELTGAELLAKAVLEAQSTIDALEAKNAEQQQALQQAAPKVEFHDVFVSEDSDLLTIRELSGKLQISETWLREMLAERKWIYSKTYTHFSNKVGKVVAEKIWFAYADKKHYFDTIFHYDVPRLGGHVRRTLKVKPAGAQAIAKCVKRWERESTWLLPELEFYETQCAETAELQ